MSLTPPSAPVNGSIINQAWGALARGDHAQACELLAPYAEETTQDAALAEVWVVMLGAIDDERHLSYELARLSARWAEESTVVLAIAQTALKWSARWLPLTDPPPSAPLPAPEGARLPELELEPVCDRIFFPLHPRRLQRPTGLFR